VDGFTNSLAPVVPAAVPASTSACVASSTIPFVVVEAFTLPPASTYAFTAFCVAILESELAAKVVSVSITEVSILSVLRLLKLVLIFVIEFAVVIPSDPTSAVMVLILYVGV
jgi:hypothetical protein